MTTLTRGQKMKLADACSSLVLEVGIGATGSGLNFDISCFGLDEAGKLSDDRYFIFFNQTQSPEGALKLLSAGGSDVQRFAVDLSRLPQSIKRMVFVITVDGAGEMRALQNGWFRISSDRSEAARFEFSGSDFSTEKAIMAGEVYFKDVWRIAAVGQGFAGGLSAVLKHFGGEEIEADSHTLAPSTPVTSSPSVSSTPASRLDKDRELQVRLEKQAPQLVNLSKTLAVTLEKKGLDEITSRVALVLDASTSMYRLYKEGAVQAVVERIATLALRLDDDGELDVWGFGERHRKFPAATLQNISGYVEEITRGGSYTSILKGLGGLNNEPPVMREVLDSYRSSSLPAFVVFISDGGVRKTGDIKKIMIEASSAPIFWQFVGLGGANYGVLENLDSMSGRVVDNANFFHVDDLASISDDVLYDRLLNEFPLWLALARSHSIVQ